MTRAIFTLSAAATLGLGLASTAAADPGWSYDPGAADGVIGGSTVGGVTSSEDIANDEDTEGHMPFRKSALPDTDKSVGADDTEDHMPHRRPALPAADESVDADDTEGHALKAH